MKKRIFPMIAAAALSATTFADTVAWYRFEEMTPGASVSSETVFTNAVDASKHSAFAGVCNFGGNSRYAKNKLTYDAAKMPYGTNAFPTEISLVNYQDSTRELSNKGALALNMHTVNSYSSPHGQFFIDDVEELRLQTFTLEFFVRVPDTTTGWRCLATRCGSAYNTKQETFRLYGKLADSGEMYLIYVFTTVEDPLYDENGAVTNQVATKEIKANITKVDSDRWRHIAIVVDGEAKTFKLYSNYTLTSTSTFTGNLYYEPGYPWAFGGHPQCTYFNTAMLLDEVRISDEALKPEKMLRCQPVSPYQGTGIVDERTLLYFDFEGGQETVTVGADDMHKPLEYTPFFANKADTLSEWRNLHAEIYRRTTVTNYVDPVATNLLPHESVRFGLLSSEGTQNTSACHFHTNSPDNDWVSPLILSPVTYNTIFTNSFTFEAYFRAPKGMVTFKETHTIQPFCCYEGFNLLLQRHEYWSRGRFSGSVGKATLNRMNPALADNENNLTAIGFLDEKWHHLALVYDEEADRADFYVDKIWRLGATNILFNPSHSNGAYIKPLMLAGSYWNDRTFVDFMIDDVRITRGALRPYEFLTTIPVESGDLARASFENNLVITPYTNFFGAAGTGSAFTEGGVAPVYVRDTPARELSAGPGGDTAMKPNRYSLDFSGGQVVYPGRAFVADRDEFTVEFFLKSASPAAGASIMRVNRGSDSAVTDEVTWALSFADAEGNLRLKVDTDELAGQTHDFTASFADGKWHHVGMQFMTDDGDTVVKLFRDGDPVGEWKTQGTILTRPRLMNLMLGAGEDPATGFTGRIDELRITPGFLDESAFLTPVRYGLIMTIR